MQNASKTQTLLAFKLVASLTDENDWWENLMMRRKDVRRNKISQVQKVEP